MWADRMRVRCRFITGVLYVNHTTGFHEGLQARSSPCFEKIQDLMTPSEAPASARPATVAPASSMRQVDEPGRLTGSNQSLANTKKRGGRVCAAGIFAWAPI